MRFGEPYWQFWQQTIEAPREAEQRAINDWAHGFEARMRQR